MASEALTASAMPAIVGSVYDCVADAARWPSTLEAICRAAEARLATLAVLDTVSGQPRFSCACGDPALVDPLVGDYSREVPFYSALPAMEIDVPFTVDMIYAIQGEGARDAWLSSRIVREWVVPNGLDDFFWTVLVRQPARAGTLVVVTDRDRHEIGAEELQAMALLAPHVRRAVVIGDLFEEERQVARMFRDIVESLAHPVLVVAADMRILFANPAAEALLADRATVTATHGRLGFAYAPADAAIARAVSLGSGDEFALGPAGIDVPLVRAQAPAVAHVLPLARREREARLATPAAAAIFIAAAGCGPLAAIDAIAALFGLTAAEKRVAGHVAAGRSRGEIAAAGGVSDGTVKTQLAAIFDKTGAGDQRALQLLIRELSPPLRPSP
jgi:DNA-binding CsgD family transcriptional regulator